MLEGDVKKEIDKVLDRFKPDLWWHKPVQNGMGKPCLDYHFCYFGLYMAIEAKAPGKPLSKRQQGTKKEIEDAGGTVLVIDGTDDTCTYDDLNELLKMTAKKRGQLSALSSALQ